MCSGQRHPRHSGHVEHLLKAWSCSEQEAGCTSIFLSHKRQQIQLAGVCRHSPCCLGAAARPRTEEFHGLLKAFVQKKSHHQSCGRKTRRAGAGSYLLFIFKSRKILWGIGIVLETRGVLNKWVALDFIFM